MATVRLKKGRLKTLQPRNPLIYSESIGKTRGSFSAGDIVEVQDYNGEFLGRGYMNPKSDVAIRVLSWRQNEAIDEALFRNRIQAAFLSRKALGVDRLSNAYRIVNSEGDNLPGLVVDRYGDYLVFQIETLGMARFEESIVRTLEELFEPKAVIGRPDLAMMDQEGFEAREGVIRGDCPEPVIPIEEDGLVFSVDLLEGQGTGFYLNQRDNRLALSRLCENRRVLDCFTYSGAFAITAGCRGKAEQVFGIESSARAMDLAGRNLSQNDSSNVVILQGEVFWELQNLVNRSEVFDVVIVDPPRLITSWKTMEKGIQTYKVLNTLSLMVVRENGVLVTCTSSEILEEEVFENVLSECASESGRTLRIFKRAGPSADFPKNPACPRTRSLRAFHVHVT